MNRILALWQTAIGKKIAMAASGFLLLLFLVSHMISNVTVLPPSCGRSARCFGWPAPVCWRWP